MARYTDRWGLSILGPGDSLQAEGFKFADADRRLIDRVLKFAAETHHHTGADGTDRTPDAGLGLMLSPTGGSIPSGTRYYYRFTVVDEDGNESAGSPIQSIDMPLSIVAPQAPAPSPITGTGDLLPGTYSYVFSAYKDATSLETKATNSAAVKIPGTNPNNSVSIILPDLPLGATGLNAYRKTPSGMHYLYIDSIAAPTTGQIWIDDGTVEGDCDRSLPAVNRTSNNNSVSATYPGATPSIPDGWAWRVYRTENPADWGRSYLTEIGPEGATPFTPVNFIDVGSATQVGGPPNVAQVIKSPPKINLNDAAEVQGSLPPGLIVGPQMISFNEPGLVTVHDGAFTWVCDFEMADIMQCRAYLDVGSMPASQPVIIDIKALRPSVGSSTWTSIFDSTFPQVDVGDTIGDPVVPIVRHLEAGDALAVDVVQAGGGATPLDYGLTVNILLYTKDGSETVTYSFAA